jgi:hypothetical protein
MMNERIKELAEQAGITTNLDTDYFEKDINKWVDYYSEKFAELIVKECADIAYKTSWDALFYGYGQAVIPLHLYNTIKQHFGVEE